MTKRLGLLCSATDDGTVLDVGRLPEAAAAYGVEVFVVDVRQPDARSLALDLGIPVWLTRFANRPYGHDAAQALDAQGATVFNASPGVRVAANQAMTLQVLRGNGLPVPKFIIKSSQTTADEVVAALGMPLVAKHPFTSGGSGVFLLNSAHDLVSALGNPEITIFQEFLWKAHGVDFRYLVVGDEVIAAMRREAASEEWRANLQLGATATCVMPDAKAIHLALATVEALELDIAGIDLISTAAGDWKVIEANPKPGWRIDAVCRIDSAARILAHIAQHYAWDELS